MPSVHDRPLGVEDYVEKVGGDYTFRGFVVAVFNKRRSGEIRYVVENDDGVLHIFSGMQLRVLRAGPMTKETITPPAR
jgi:hypothetical protein